VVHVESSTKTVDISFYQRKIAFMQETFHPTALQKIGNDLAIAWSDGAESFINLETLRRRCPCATCMGEPDVMGNLTQPRVAYQAKSFELVSWQTIGGYAIQPKWGDGHSTGIFSYPYLRRLDCSKVG